MHALETSHCGMGSIPPPSLCGLLLFLLSLSHNCSFYVFVCCMCEGIQRMNIRLRAITMIGKYVCCVVCCALHMFLWGLLSYVCCLGCALWAVCCVVCSRLVGGSIQRANNSLIKALSAVIQMWMYALHLHSLSYPFLLFSSLSHRSCFAAALCVCVCGVWCVQMSWQP